MDADNVRRGEVVVPCTDLDAALALLRPLGFRLESIFPADAPALAVVTGHGLRLRLERGAAAPAPVVRLVCREPEAIAGGARELELPGGARIQLVEEARGLEVPPLVPSYVVVRGPTGAWGAGRVGMQYRDLLPDRQGGRFIASHIRIPGGGLVPDYVHYHTIRFQIIYCHRGWVRALYEDQGEAFLMEEGDCVLQPPRIRHRVLECSAGFEAIEVGSPARQETRVDHELELPSPERARDYDGQRFVMSRAAAARWEPARYPGWRARDLGVAAASGGLVSAQVLRSMEPGVRLAETHAGELLWGCVLRGAATLDGAHRLEAADAFTVPAGRPFELADATADLEWLLVTVP
jgi:quercetin dioxygenase-like cupin family protein